MPRNGDWSIGGFSRFWSIRGKAPLIASCVTLATVLVFAACAGVNDNGTTFDTLATVEARRNAPPPTDGSPDPSGDPGDPAQMAAAGRQIYNTAGCAGCHSIDGSTMVGPSWQGLWGAEVALADGSTVTGDEQYITTSILEPGAQVHDGFPNVMPSYQGQLDDTQIQSVIEFIKTLE